MCIVREVKEIIVYNFSLPRLWALSLLDATELRPVEIK